MELKEILASTPGLNRRFVHYLEAKGYIQPLRVRKQRISRREYREADLATIQDIWRYYQRGYAPQSAYELATKVDRAVGYITFLAAPAEWAVILEAVRGYPQVVEASCVYGASLDIILKTDTPDESEVYASLMPVLTRLGLQGPPHFLLTEHRFRRERGTGKGERAKGMQAYLVIRASGTDVEQVLEALKALEAVREASTVYGESDIIAKVHVATQEELDDLVMNKVHGIPAVESTRTYIVVSSLHWSR